MCSGALQRECRTKVVLLLPRGQLLQRRADLHGRGAGGRRLYGLQLREGVVQRRLVLEGLRQRRAVGVRCDKSTPGRVSTAYRLALSGLRYDSKVLPGRNQLSRAGFELARMHKSAGWLSTAQQQTMMPSSTTRRLPQ